MTRYVHTNLIARDAKRLIAFYKEALGLKSIGETRDLSGEWLDRLTGVVGAHIVGEHLLLPGYGDDHPTLEIFSYEPSGAVPDRKINAPGFAHIAFEVDDVEESLKRYSRSAAACSGNSCTRTIRTGAGRRSYMRRTSRGTSSSCKAGNEGGMQNLIKPERLRRGDTVATVSLSWGGAGDPDLLWRYNAGKRRIKEQFGLRVIEMEHALRGSEFLYRHPELRARDLMDAFRNPSVKAIFSCIGGDESVRMLPFIDFDVIRENPKIFLGYSDSTITHLICRKAGLSSFYGPSVLAEFAENVRMFEYTADWVERVLFRAEPLGEIPAAEYWTGERIEWKVEYANVEKKRQPNRGYELLQGTGKATGRLIGGCVDVLEMAKGTMLWPEAEAFDGAMLFLETSEDMPEPAYLTYWLRNYASQGILQRVSALLIAKPYQEKYYEEYKASIRTVLNELGLCDLPVLYNMTFGHNEPMCVLPYGALAEVNCETRTFAILESGVL